MERRKEEKVGDIVMRFLRQSQLEQPLNEYRAIQAWGKIAGFAAERSTQKLYIYNQKLFVHLRSAVLRNELLMRRSELVQKINNSVGTQVITDITFR